jgi:hypothetical protein
LITGYAPCCEIDRAWFIFFLAKVCIGTHFIVGRTVGP